MESFGASPRIFAASGPDAYANDWFTRGLITWLSGANTGRKAEVRLHSKSGEAVSIELWQRLAEPIAAGDSFSIVAGCDKQFATCRAKFANVPNFRGFPHVPGNDFVLHVASRKDKQERRPELVPVRPRIGLVWRITPIGASIERCRCNA